MKVQRNLVPSSASNVCGAKAPPLLAAHLEALGGTPDPEGTANAMVAAKRWLASPDAATLTPTQRASVEAKIAQASDDLGILIGIR